MFISDIAIACLGYWWRRFAISSILSINKTSSDSTDGYILFPDGTTQDTAVVQSPTGATGSQDPQDPKVQWV